MIRAHNLVQYSIEDVEGIRFGHFGSDPSTNLLRMNCCCWYNFSLALVSYDRCFCPARDLSSALKTALATIHEVLEFDRFLQVERLVLLEYEPRSEECSGVVE
jgi:hypothetical protein